MYRHVFFFFFSDVIPMSQHTGEKTWMRMYNLDPPRMHARAHTY